MTQLNGILAEVLLKTTIEVLQAAHSQQPLNWPEIIGQVKAVVQPQLDEEQSAFARQLRSQHPRIKQQHIDIEAQNFRAHLNAALDSLLAKHCPGELNGAV